MSLNLDDPDSPSPTSRRASYHHGNLRQALIDATVTLVEENGASNVTVAQAAKRAGVSSGAPFRHFPDRKALMTAVAVEAMDRLRIEVGRALEELEAANALERFGAIGTAYLRWAFRNPAHFEVISTRSLIDFEGSSLRQSNDDVRTLMAALLIEAREKNLVKPGNLQLIQVEARALVYGLARMYVDGQFPSWELDTQRPEDVAHAILAQYLQSIKSPTSAN